MKFFLISISILSIILLNMSSTKNELVIPEDKDDSDKNITQKKPPQKTNSPSILAKINDTPERHSHKSESMDRRHIDSDETVPDSNQADAPPDPALNIIDKPSKNTWYQIEKVEFSNATNEERTYTITCMPIKHLAHIHYKRYKDGMFYYNGGYSPFHNDLNEAAKDACVIGDMRLKTIKNPLFLLS